MRTHLKIIFTFLILFMGLLNFTWADQAGGLNLDDFLSSPTEQSLQDQGDQQMVPDIVLASDHSVTPALHNQPFFPIFRRWDRPRWRRGGEERERWRRGGEERERWRWRRGGEEREGWRR